MNYCKLTFLMMVFLSTNLTLVFCQEGNPPIFETDTNVLTLLKKYYFGKPSERNPNIHLIRTYPAILGDSAIYLTASENENQRAFGRIVYGGLKENGRLHPDDSDIIKVVDEDKRVAEWAKAGEWGNYGVSRVVSQVWMSLETSYKKDSGFFRPLLVDLADLKAAKSALEVFSLKNDLTYAWSEGELSSSDICRAIDRDMPLLITERNRFFVCSGYLVDDKNTYAIITDATPGERIEAVRENGEKVPMGQSTTENREILAYNLWLSSWRLYKLTDKKYTCVFIRDWRHNLEKMKGKIIPIIPESIREATVFLENQRRILAEDKRKAEERAKTKADSEVKKQQEGK